MEFKNWEGQDLDGLWLFTYKIDGIQAKLTEDGMVSKNNKKLYNVTPPNHKFQIAEVFCGSWNETMSIVSASKAKRRQVRREEIYPLYPITDRRLLLGLHMHPTKALIEAAFRYARAQNYEGLVLRKMTGAEEEFIKVKEKYTIDVPIIGLEVSTAQSHKGLLKEFITPMGKVGTGLTLEQRKEYFNDKLIGTYIEVEATEITKNGKFRHPRFIRLRPDK